MFHLNPLALFPLCLLACVACKSVPGKSRPATVEVSLYVYPPHWPYSLLQDTLRKKGALQELKGGRKVYATTVDMAEREKAHSNDLRPNHASGLAPVFGLVGWLPSRLPKSFFREVGWIEWFVVTPGANNQPTKVISAATARHRKQSLIDLASEGDEIIGIWGF